ncbi:MAG: helicase-associated domain-containing protein [Microbacteriaceae bacterium]|nr:helicase-associated domain-containing protein [Microbacteriaceae bacterium]
MSEIPELAARLRALDNDRLAALVRSREIRATGIKDFFDLAELMLASASVQSQLSRLDRGMLAMVSAISRLGTIAEQSPDAAPVTLDSVATLLESFHGPLPLTGLTAQRNALLEKFLVYEVPAIAAAPDTAAEAAPGNALGELRAYECVVAQLGSWPSFGLPSLTELASRQPPTPLAAVSETDSRIVDRVAAERAFAVTSEMTEFLLELEREPARELAKGGITLPDSKRLANAMSTDLDGVPRVLAIAGNAGLTAREGGSWLITDAGGAWLLESSGRRWQTLAAGWHAQLPTDIRSLLNERQHVLWGHGLREFVDWLYPAGGERIDERVTAYTRDAEQLGITANLAPSGPGALLLGEGPDAASRAMAALFPTEVEHVYLQHDLSVVAPGPLAPSIDYRLRSMADVESRALASSYRISTATLNRAMAAGETAESLREFLSGISSTGMPQPLDYLITETARRYGLIRVGEFDDGAAINPGGPHDEQARSYIRSNDDALLGTLLVDQTLAVLGLRRISGTMLHSRVALDTVFWAISDARYPIAAEDAEQSIVSLRRRRHARGVTAVGANPILDLIERLRIGSEAQPDESMDAWLGRQLDTAIRTRAALTVTVSMPNGTIVDYQLEPTSVAGGRLRARDRRSAIERTLPLSRITAIAPAADSL